MRYLVYSWDSDDIKSYDDTYGDGAFDADSSKPSCFGSISQFGRLVKETNDIDEAYKINSKEFDRLDYNGMSSIWDSEEKEWFN